MLASDRQRSRSDVQLPRSWIAGGGRKVVGHTAKFNNVNPDTYRRPPARFANASTMKARSSRPTRRKLILTISPFTKLKRGRHRKTLAAERERDYVLALRYVFSKHLAADGMRHQRLSFCPQIILLAGSSRVWCRDMRRSGGHPLMRRRSRWATCHPFGDNSTRFAKRTSKIFLSLWGGLIAERFTGVLSELFRQLGDGHVIAQQYLRQAPDYYGGFQGEFAEACGIVDPSPSTRSAGLPAA